MEDSVRWSLKVSRATDAALRAHLGRTGGRKGDLSRFVQEAVRAKLDASQKRGRTIRTKVRGDLAEALAQIRTRTRSLPRARFERLVAEAVGYARKRR